MKIRDTKEALPEGFQEVDMVPGLSTEALIKLAELQRQQRETDKVIDALLFVNRQEGMKFFDSTGS